MDDWNEVPDGPTWPGPPPSKRDSFAQGRMNSPALRAFLDRVKAENGEDETLDDIDQGDTMRSSRRSSGEIGEAGCLVTAIVIWLIIVAMNIAFWGLVIWALIKLINGDFTS